MTSPILFVAGSIGSLLATLYLDYETQFPMKVGAFALYVGMTGMGLVPLLHMYKLISFAHAGIATGIMMASLGAVAWNAPD